MESAKNILHPRVALTKNMELTSGAHLLYVYSDHEKYIENAVSFLAAGLEFGHGAVLIEHRSMYEKVIDRLASKGFSQKQLDTIIFADNDEFYGAHQSFNISAVLKTFADVIKPYTENDIPVRTWSKVRWGEGHCCVLENLPIYELQADQDIESVRIFTVCSYNGAEIPANIHMELMKSHQYVMTDTELTPSLFYRKHNHAPSLFMEEQLEEKIHHLNEEFQMINSHYRNLIAEMPEPVLITENFRIIYGNRAAAQLFECEMDAFPGKSIWAIFQPEFHEAIRGRFYQLTIGEKLPLAEMQVKTFKGSIIDVEVVSFPFVFHDPSQFTDISIIRSIKERKEHQQLTIKTEKLSIAGQLAASIAHEVRNPLTSIKGFVKLAKEGSINSDHYNIIEDEIDRIETIASELLVLGKPLSIDMKMCDAGKMLRDVCMLLQPQAVMKRIDIKYEDVNDGCPVFCNAGQMKQVFINIIKNAIEAMNDGGVIRASAQIKDQFIVICIEDEGKGIQESVLERLGEPFYSTKEDGTGLGLMVCFNIVEQYGGKIDVHSEVNAGTAFTIRLPIGEN
ncbi:hypothetical protein BTO30_10635 [Domibacillus antri]|uniref:histidine kinase n=1 Tax=Domibacillus antri TaxID=1714264 RepID=A0A1Q8Q4E7_9BACI|nr:ATP-binding protein [Domibacillus antri]OLN22198.1 hypothetical protein BTO30_10635 [Domibacillus antri]